MSSSGSKRLFWWFDVTNEFSLESGDKKFPHGGPAARAREGARKREFQGHVLLCAEYSSEVISSDAVDQSLGKHTDVADHDVNENLVARANCPAISQASQIEKDDEHIKVFVRIRPLAKDNESETLSAFVNGPHSVKIAKGSSIFEGEFDRVFDVSATQQEIFENLSSSIRRVLEGQNAAIFAYGQTNTGKTFTMLGPPRSLGLDSRGEVSASAGLIPRVMSSLVKLCSSSEVSDARFDLECSYVQVYNEKVLDLLAPMPKAGQAPTPASELDIRTTASGAVDVAGMVKRRVASVRDLLDVLILGGHARKVRETRDHACSNRSHTILQIHVTASIQGAAAADGPHLWRSKLSLVDLAGSERHTSAAAAANVGTAGSAPSAAEHLGEMININRSLTTLGRIVTLRSEGAKAGLPYRESKLTRLLQDSLGGACSTTFIATISPNQAAAEESLSTLKFALCARRVKLQLLPAALLDVPPGGPISEVVQRYEREICRLKARLAASIKANKGVTAEEEAAERLRRAEERAAAQQQEVCRLRVALREAQAAQLPADAAGVAALAEERQQLARLLDRERQVTEKLKEAIRAALNKQSAPESTSALPPPAVISARGPAPHVPDAAAAAHQMQQELQEQLQQQLQLQLQQRAQQQLQYEQQSAEPPPRQAWTDAAPHAGRWATSRLPSRRTPDLPARPPLAPAAAGAAVDNLGLGSKDKRVLPSPYAAPSLSSARRSAPPRPDVATAQPAGSAWAAQPAHSAAGAASWLRGEQHSAPAALAVAPMQYQSEGRAGSRARRGRLVQRKAALMGLAPGPSIMVVPRASRELQRALRHPAAAPGDHEEVAYPSHHGTGHAGRHDAASAKPEPPAHRSVDGDAAVHAGPGPAPGGGEGAQAPFRRRRHWSGGPRRVAPDGPEREAGRRAAGMAVAEGEAGDDEGDVGVDAWLVAAGPEGLFGRPAAPSQPPQQRLSAPAPVPSADAARRMWGAGGVGRSTVRVEEDSAAAARAWPDHEAPVPPARPLSAGPSRVPALPLAAVAAQRAHLDEATAAAASASATAPSPPEAALARTAAAVTRSGAPAAPLGGVKAVEHAPAATGGSGNVPSQLPTGVEVGGAGAPSGSASARRELEELKAEARRLMEAVRTGDSDMSVHEMRARLAVLRDRLRQSV